MACGGRHKQGDKKEKEKRKMESWWVLAGEILSQLEEGLLVLLRQVRGEITREGIRKSGCR